MKRLIYIFFLLAFAQLAFGQTKQVAGLTLSGNASQYLDGTGAFSTPGTSSVITGGTGDHTIDQGVNGYAGLAGDRRNGTAAIIGSDPSNTANLSMHYAWIAPCDGTLQKFYVNLDDAPGTSNSVGFTIRKNGSNTTLTTTISNSATSNSDVTHTVSVTAGDYLAIYITPSASLANTISYAGWSVEFVAGSGGGGMTNPMTTTGDMIYSSSGSTPARLAIGATDKYLTVSGGVPAWSSNTISLAGSFTTSGANALTLTTTGATNVTLPTSGTLVNSAVTTLSSLVSVGTLTTGTWNATKISEAYGGTNQSTYTTGDMLYSSSSNTLGKLAIGGTGKFLTVSGGVPVWSTPTIPNTAGTSGKVLISDGTNFVSSTPTYPNSGGTENYVVQSDGTNFTTAFGGWTTVKVASSNFTTTSTSLTDITGLSFSATASTKYEINVVLYANSSTGTAGVQFGINSTGTSPRISAVLNGNGNATSRISSATTANNTAMTACLTTAGQYGIITIQGIVESGTGSPTISIRGLKATSGTLTVYVGSYFQYRILQ